MVSIKFLVFVSCFVTVAICQEKSPQNFNSAFRMMRKVYSDCEQSVDILKCLKVQAIRLTERALKIQNIKIVDGISVTRNEKVEGRAFSEPIIPEIELAALPAKSVDNILSERTTKFLDTHEIQVDIPRLLSSAGPNGARLIEEGRKKMKKYQGPFMAAMAIKGGILAMAYHSIAIVAGKALIIGKIALIISAIIGLKKLVTPEGHEKTTYEIVKHPHVQQSHSYSSSHGEYEGGHEGGGQYRSFKQDGDLVMQDRAYKAYKPT